MYIYIHTYVCVCERACVSMVVVSERSAISAPSENALSVSPLSETIKTYRPTYILYTHIVYWFLILL